MTEATPATGPAREFVSFHLGDQTFCIDIMAVREIRGWTATTVVPGAPDFVAGVINLRGTVLPIVDLSARLGFGPARPTVRHVIIGVQIGGQIVGLLVDAVSDILTLSSDDIQPPPGAASDAANAVVQGLVAIEQLMISVISLDQVMPATQQRAA